MVDREAAICFGARSYHKWPYRIAEHVDGDNEGAQCMVGGVEIS